MPPTSSRVRFSTPALFFLSGATALVVGVGVPLLSVIPALYVPAPEAVTVSNAMFYGGVLLAPAAAATAVGLASDTDTMVTTFVTGYGTMLAGAVVGAVALPPLAIAGANMPRELIPAAAIAGATLFGVVGGVVGSALGPAVHQSRQLAEEAVPPTP